MRKYFLKNPLQQPYNIQLPHFPDQLHVDPVVDVADPLHVGVVPGDDVAPPPENALAGMVDGAEREAGNQELIPSRPD